MLDQFIDCLIHEISLSAIDQFIIEAAITQTGYGTTSLGCRGGSWYFEGCWGFPYLKTKRFKVVWFYGFMVLWLYGFMVLSFYGFMVFCFSGFEVLKFYGFLFYGCMIL